MKHSIIFMLFITCTLLGSELMLKETKFAYVKESLGKGRVHFVEVGSDTCKSCKIMGKQLYKVQQKHPTYNISFVNVKKEREVAYALKISMIPTQLIFDKEGNEVYRHVGILGSDALVDLFKTYKFDVQ